MSEALLLALLQGLTPIIAGVIRNYQASHQGATPTDAQIHAILEQNIALYLSEGAQWKNNHPT